MLKNNKLREEYIRNEDNWKLLSEHPDGFRVRVLEIGSLIFYKFEIKVSTFYKLKDSDPDTH
ncbi:hypothetical protein [Breznakia pachnodae]|uniref:Uncharacterized protein n=1 Tax=Breznakia pachnodae TaxID=265178 RepID=A0ABU0E6P4_9FIRM|nr:hypothetical protein [Breznakia pachnodae]MDQ0362578.1 hypothetical protein [Breznakia pachnodae]